MRRAASLVCVAVLAGALLSGCSGKDEDSEGSISGGVVPVSLQDDGKVVVGGVGATFSLRLGENSSTGYSWTTTAAPDPAVVKEVSSTYKEADPGLLGGGGVREWRFEAVGAGETRLGLDYTRSFGNEEAANTFSVTFRVEE